MRILTITYPENTSSRQIKKTISIRSDNLIVGGMKE